MTKAMQTDGLGHFGVHGGRFVPETLMSPLEELEAAYAEAWADVAFKDRLNDLLQNYSGRPTSLYLAERMSERIGARLYLKREDLNHTGAHKINNALGQALLARRMGKKRIIAETGAGQHGVASATACALLDLDCEVYMGREDMHRQAPNVFRIELLGGTVIPVDSGSATLKDAVNEAMRDWVTNVADTFYLLGSAVGPHPYPLMVREFQSVIGRETRDQMIAAEGRLPDVVIACVGGGSNAIGMFHPFIKDDGVRLIGVEAGGRGPNPGDNAARIGTGEPGVLHGTHSYLLQDEYGQVLPTHSVSAGLDYPLIGPEHAHLYDAGRAEYSSVSDEQALEAFHELSKLEGIIPALESSHALAYLLERAGSYAPDTVIALNLSGRGDKDVETVSSLQRP